MPKVIRKTFRCASRLYNRMHSPPLPLPRNVQRNDYVRGCFFFFHFSFFVLLSCMQHTLSCLCSSCMYMQEGRPAGCCLVISFAVCAVLFTPIYLSFHLFRHGSLPSAASNNNGSSSSSSPAEAKKAKALYSSPCQRIDGGTLAKILRHVEYITRNPTPGPSGSSRPRVDTDDVSP